jgi:RimJ/RimL family protein N-acetyltransferase
VSRRAQFRRHPRDARTPRLALPLRTPRLEIREFAPADLDALCQFVCDARVTRFMLQAPRDRDQALAYLEQVIGYQAERPRSAWELAVIRREDQALIGACTLTLLAAGEADLGYMLLRNVWGQGLATELASALIGAGFHQLKLRRISSTVDVRNRASIRVLEKAGLRWDATYRRLRKVRGEWRDCHLFGIGSAEWLARAGPPA